MTRRFRIWSIMTADVAVSGRPRRDDPRGHVSRSKRLHGQRGTTAGQLGTLILLRELESRFLTVAALRQLYSMSNHLTAMLTDLLDCGNNLIHGGFALQQHGVMQADHFVIRKSRLIQFIRRTESS